MPGCLYMVNDRPCAKPVARSTVSYCAAHYRRIYKAPGQIEDAGFDAEAQRAALTNFWRRWHRGPKVNFMTDEHNETKGETS